MNEERAKYHLDGEEAEPGPLPIKERISAEAESVMWEKIITAIAISPEWFASRLNEDQAAAIVKAIVERFPQALHNHEK